MYVIEFGFNKEHEEIIQSKNNDIKEIVCQKCNDQIASLYCQT